RSYESLVLRQRFATTNRRNSLSNFALLDEPHFHDHCAMRSILRRCRLVALLRSAAAHQQEQANRQPHATLRAEAGYGHRTKSTTQHNIWNTLPHFEGTSQLIVSAKADR